MKKILGSLILLSLSLFARSDYKWTVELNENQLYMQQSTVLTMTCKFAKEGKHDDVEFIPPTNLPFEFKLLSEKKHFNGDLQTVIYKYLLFAQKEGSYELILKPIMLFTTQSAINNVIEGRDNINDLEVEKEMAMIPSLSINVKATQSTLTGILELSTELDLTEVSAYEPVHLEISIKGSGNLQTLSALSFEIEGVEIFADNPEKKLVLNDKGYEGVWLQRFAFVGIKDFLIPSITIRYFDLNENVEKVLTTKEFKIKIKVDGIKKEDLIDTVNLPSSKIDFYSYLDYLYYFLTFIAGFIVAKLVKIPKKTKNMKKGFKIKSAKTAKELLEVLIVCDDNLFEKEICELESAVYKDTDIKIKEVKKEALKKL